MENNDPILAIYLEEMKEYGLLDREQEIQLSSEIDWEYESLMSILCEHRSKSKPRVPGLSLLEKKLSKVRDVDEIYQEFMVLYERISHPLRKKNSDGLNQEIFELLYYPRSKEESGDRCIVPRRIIDYAARELLTDPELPEKYGSKIRSCLDSINELKKEFVENNLRLVVGTAKQYQGRGLSFADLIQEGNLGVIKALDVYDFRTGNKFSSCATWWIKHNILRAIANTGRTIRNPVHLIDFQKKIRRAQKQLIGLLKRKPTLEEISEHTGESLKKIEQSFIAKKNPFSLNKPLNGDESLLLQDILVDKSTMPLEESLREKDREIIDQLIKGTSITPKERGVLIRRFGLYGMEEQTLKEIGKEYGLSRERVRQIEIKALDKLNKELLKESAEDYLQIFNEAEQNI